MRYSVDRGMWPEAALAALATLAVAWPLTTLLRGGDWIGPAVLAVALVMVIGCLLRSLDLDPTLIVLGQTVAVIGALLFRYLRETLIWGFVPGPDTLESALGLVQDAGRVLQNYAAPAPAPQSVEFLIVAVLALTAVSVDSIGVTGRAPATAGIPLAAAFLVSVSNTGDAMQPWFFAAAALAWLLMVAQQGNRLVSGWSSAERRETVGSHDVTYGPTGHRRLARALAGVTVLGALLIASVVPHLPPTFFADGLARNSEGRSVGGGGQVSFTETMDVTADLNNQSREPVLRYRAQTRLSGPLRVTASTEFDGQRWLPPDFIGDVTSTGQLSVPQGGVSDVADGIQVDTRGLDVLGNDLRMPHLAVPAPLESVRSDVAMSLDLETGAVRVADPVDNYHVQYAEVGLRGELPSGIGDLAAEPAAWGPYLDVDPTSESAVRALNEEIVGGATNDLEVASLIQRYLRSGLFTYDLELAPGLNANDPITHFLETRQGYCVQFATAMVMMARAEGIPARMAIGFLPGELQVDGTYAVVAANAHTWPELWIDGMGWTRFEPTPGIQTGPPPAYSQLDTTTAEDDPTLTNPNTPSATATQDPTGAQGENSWWDGVTSFLSDAWPILLRSLVIVLVIGLLGSIIAIAGRRHRESVLRNAETPQERIEGQWELLKRSLEDYGIDPPPDRSPRAMGEHYTTKARLDRPAGAAMGRATATLERARYAAPEQTSESDDRTMHSDVLRVLDSVSAKLPWNIRLSAKLFPRSGVHYIRSLLSRWRR